MYFSSTLAKIESKLWQEMKEILLFRLPFLLVASKYKMGFSQVCVLELCNAASISQGLNEKE